MGIFHGRKYSSLSERKEFVKYYVKKEKFHLLRIVWQTKKAFIKFL